MFAPLTLANALHVASRLRENDLACVRAVMGTDNPEAFAVNRWQTEGPAWCVLQDDEPTVLCGLSFNSSWSAVLWMVATPRINGETWRKLIRKARTVLTHATDPRHPEYRHRVEAFVYADWIEAQRFITRLGFTHEGTRKSAGSGGEDIQTWTLIGPAKGRAWR